MIYVLLIIASIVFFGLGYYAGYVKGAEDGMLYAMENMILKAISKVDDK